jgi:hypothetical protein
VRFPDPRRRRLGDRPTRASRSTTRGRPRAVHGIEQGFRAGPTRKLVTLPLHINDEAFADALVAAWRESRAAGALRRIDHQGRRPCPASLDSALLERFRAKIAARPADRRRRRRHRPVGQVRRGRRHRPDRDLQLRPLPDGRARLAGGLLAYGNANQIVCEMAREVLPWCSDTPVLAGVNGTDPFMIRASSCAS